MSKLLGKANLENIIDGATFLGAGGGGSAEQGYYLLNKIEEKLGKIEIELADPEEMNSHELAVMVASIGAPRVMKQKGFGSEALYGFEFISSLCSLGGRSVNYLMAGELGGFNTLVPIYVSAINAVPLVDADGNGRAVPELSTTLYSAFDISLNPLVVANSSGDIAVVYLKDPLNYENAETTARSLTVAWGTVASFATWVVDKQQIVANLAPGTISRSEEIGRIFRRNANKKDVNSLSEDLKDAGAVELFVGKISSLETKTKEGFDFGTTVVCGEGKYDGATMAIDFKNENIIARVDDRIVAMVPDLISIVDIETMKPITNADTTQGQRIAVYGTPAPGNWMKTPRGFLCWKHILHTLGYTGEYVPLRTNET